MSHEIKRGRLHTIIRRSEPYDIEAQVKALKQLQKQPTFMARKPVSERKESQLSFRVSSLITETRRLAYNIATFKKKWIIILLLFFRHKRKLALPSQIKR